MKRGLAGVTGGVVRCGMAVNRPAMARRSPQVPVWLALALGLLLCPPAGAETVLTVPIGGDVGERAEAPPGAPVLTEAEAIRIALAQPEREALLRHRRDLAQSDLTAARAWPNPRADYSREEVPRVFGQDVNEFYWLTQSLDVSGRRMLRREAATTRLRATDASATFERIEIASLTRQRFFDLLHQKSRFAEYGVWLERLARLAGLVAEREREDGGGRRPGYGKLRVASEQATARLAREQEYALVQAAWTALETICGSVHLRSVFSDVTGQLDPDPPPTLEAALATVERRPDFVAWRQELEALGLEVRVAGRAWVPDLTLGVGSKRVADDLGDDSGPMVSLGLAVPLFDRGRAQRQRSAAEAGASRNGYVLALRTARGAVREAWEEASRLAGLARARRSEIEQIAFALVEMADRGYRQGEISLIELLDAYKNEHDGRLQVLDLESAARTAQLELERLTRERPG